MVDVILPVLDEALALPWVLQRLPAGYRAIVADNGSTDGSPELAGPSARSSSSSPGAGSAPPAGPG
jgi:hypothetical protein